MGGKKLKAHRVGAATPCQRRGRHPGAAGSLPARRQGRGGAEGGSAPKHRRPPRGPLAPRWVPSRGCGALNRVWAGWRRRQAAEGAVWRCRCPFPARPLLPAPPLPPPQPAGGRRRPRWPPWRCRCCRARGWNSGGSWRTSPRSSAWPSPTAPASFGRRGPRPGTARWARLPPLHAPRNLPGGGRGLLGPMRLGHGEGRGSGAGPQPPGGAGQGAPGAAGSRGPVADSPRGQLGVQLPFCRVPGNPASQLSFAFF